MDLIEVVSCKKKKQNKVKGNYGKGKWSSDSVMDEEKTPCSDHFDNKEFLSAGHQQKVMLI